MIFFLVILLKKLLGIIFGYLLPYVDVFVYAYWLHPEREESIALQQLVHARAYRSAIGTIRSMLEQPYQFIHRSIMFLGGFFLLSLFVVTSTRSSVGNGMLIGFGLHLIQHMFPYLKNKDDASLRMRFFWGLAETTPPTTIRGLAIGFVVLTLVVGVLAIGLT